MKTLVIAVIILLGGCATLTLEELESQARICEVELKIPEIRNAIKRCEENDTKEACAARLPKPPDEICWQDIWDRNDMQTRREKRKAERANNCPDGMIMVCVRMSCGCSSRDSVRGIFRY